MGNTQGKDVSVTDLENSGDVIVLKSNDSVVHGFVRVGQGGVFDCHHDVGDGSMFERVSRFGKVKFPGRSMYQPVFSLNGSISAPYQLEPQAY